MKTILCLTVLSVAGLGYVARKLPDVHAALAPADHPEAFALGLRAITGQLTAERLAEFEKPFLRVLSPPAAVPPPSPSPVVSPINAANAAPVRPAVVEAWADDRGRLFVRLADGRTAQRLASGELAFQRFDGTDADTTATNP